MALLDQKRGMASLAFVIAGLGLLWACNEHDPHPPPSTQPGNSPVLGGGGGGPKNDGGLLTEAGSTNLDGGECTDLEDPTTRVDESNVSDNAPPALGGDLSAVNGTYELQTAVKYVGASGQAGPNGTTYREIIRITNANVLESNRFTQLNTGPEQRESTRAAIQTSTTSTTTLTLVGLCPGQGLPETFSYTFQNGRLTLISASGESFTYVARP